MAHSYEEAKGELALSDVKDVSLVTPGSGLSGMSGRGASFSRSASFATGSDAVLAVTTPSRELFIRGTPEYTAEWRDAIQAAVTRSSRSAQDHAEVRNTRVVWTKSLIDWLTDLALVLLLALLLIA